MEPNAVCIGTILRHVQGRQMTQEKLSPNDLYQALWASADEMRATMNADKYKDYLLGLVFYKALSDRQLHAAYDLMNDAVPPSLDEAQECYEKAWESEDGDDLRDELSEKFDCVIAPKKTFTAFYRKVNDGTFMLDDLSQAFRDVEQSCDNFYQGLFDDFDIMSSDLGKTPQERNRKVSSLIRALAAIDFNMYGYDALGDAYEYLIAKFASESGSKAGEFYTPRAVAELIAHIVTMGKAETAGFSAYDPCMGSGSLLLQARNGIKPELQKHMKFFGQELKNQTYNLARMNMILHGVPAGNQHLRNGDTLGADWPSDEPTEFDAVVMNPPYSQKWTPVQGMLQDPRFSPYEKLAPASKADLAFLLHGFYHLKQDGTMGIVLPHGVLFRGGAEGVIRQHLCENGSIHAVIGLPPNIFYSTGIPTCVIVLRKNSEKRDILFIDASKDFKKERARNLLTSDNIQKILDAYMQRKDIEKYSHLASFDEVTQNDFNLNIPRYVDTFEEEEPIDLAKAFQDLRQAEEEERKTAEVLKVYFKELGLDPKLWEDK